MGRDGGLVLVGTPIGNLEDMSPRAAAALRDADLVACEDTRRTATLMRHVGATTRMHSLHAHNEAAREAELLDRMRAGETVALVSDAGMPLVSDPGARLVRAAVAAGLPVTVIPGPSAVTSAVAVSGLAEGAGFLFAGFVPRAAGERAALLDELEAAARPVVLFESPNRLPALLAELAGRWPERGASVCRELTKLHEEVVRGPLAELAVALDAPPRGEVAVVLAPAAPAGDGDEGDARLAEAVAHMLDAGLGAGRAADLAAALGLGRRNPAYRAALAEADRRRAAT